METPTLYKLPSDHLKKLDFLLGQFQGYETLYPPDLPAIQFLANICGEREACERFLKLDFYGDIPGIGPETFRAEITYSEAHSSYRMWIFAASQEDPAFLQGTFLGASLVFVSEPTKMVWGTQRLRFTLEPHGESGFFLLGERWELDGYAKYCSAEFEQIFAYLDR